MELAQQAVSILQVGGGWAVAVFVTWALVRKDRQLSEVMEARHREFVATLNQCVVALEGIRDATKEMRAATEYCREKNK